MRGRDRFKKEIVDEECFEPYPEEPCASCGEITSLRCGCNAVVCEQCDCPDGCDAVSAEPEAHESITQVVKGGLSVLDTLESSLKKRK